ncbi:hypothetical protein PQG02_18850 [Nostoc sp. UHCC 0926]|nr:hypothetical protein PQG02_18850 [Nostoc sp. UHCC 0926]
MKFYMTLSSDRYFVTYCSSDVYDGLFGVADADKSYYICDR